MGKSVVKEAEFCHVHRPNLPLSHTNPFPHTIATSAASHAHSSVPALAYTRPLSSSRSLFGSALVSWGLSPNRGTPLPNQHGSRFQGKSWSHTEWNQSLFAFRFLKPPLSSQSSVTFKRPCLRCRVLSESSILGLR